MRGRSRYAQGFAQAQGTAVHPRFDTTRLGHYSSRSLGAPTPTKLPLFRHRLLLWPLLSPFASADTSNHENETGPTFNVAVVAWLFGLVGTTTILHLRVRATRDQEGPLRELMTGEGGMAEGAPAEKTVGDDAAVPSA